MKALYKKELQFYLNNPIGFIVIVLFAIFANFLFVKDIFVVGVASMRSFFDFLPWLFLVFVPAIGMRMLSEERRTNTIDVLLTLPISETQIVLSKFFAMITLTAIGLALTLGLPLSLYALTKEVGSSIYIPEIFVGYFGQLLLASAFAAISLFYSSQTRNQVVAFLLSAVTLFFLVVFSSDFVANLLPPMIQEFLNYLSPVTHVRSFVKGILDVRAIFYFVSFTALFLFLTIIDVEKRS